MLSFFGDMGIKQKGLVTSDNYKSGDKILFIERDIKIPLSLIQELEVS